MRAERTVTLTTGELADKIRGAWAAQTIGCAFGGPTEFRYQERMIPDDEEIKWDEHQPRNYFDNGPGLYDDVYMNSSPIKLGQNRPKQTLNQIV